MHVEMPQNCTSSLLPNLLHWCSFPDACRFIIVCVCYRTNPGHAKQYRHPDRDREEVKRKEAQGDDICFWWIENFCINIKTKMKLYLYFKLSTHGSDFKDTVVLGDIDLGRLANLSGHQ